MTGSCRCRGVIVSLCGLVGVGIPAGGLRAQTMEQWEPKVRTPVRVLMLVGGVAHDYDALPRQLADNLGKQGSLKVDITSDLADVNAKKLADYDVILFNTCIEKGLDETQRKDLVEALRQGKGLVGLHCALWTFQDWPEFRKILGALVLKHDKFAPSENVVVDRNHPIVAGVPDKFTITSEPYFVDEPSDDMHVIVRTTQVYADRKGVEPQVWTTRYAGSMRRAW